MENDGEELLEIKADIAREKARLLNQIRALQEELAVVMQMDDSLEGITYPV